MARYRGPVEKIERRLEADLGLKGERRLSGKSALTKRPFPPGQHGQRRTKVSEYGLQLREKQKVKFMYGVSEKQFSNYFKEAVRREGNTRAFARQITTHGHVLVDGKKVDIPSYLVKAGQKIEIKEKSKSNPQIIRALELINQTGMVDWVNVDKDKVFGIFTRIPSREEIVIPVEERLIVELYSK